MPKPFVEEVESGDRMRALVALRGELARAIDCVTDAGDLSSLALRLTRVLEQIAELGGDQPKEGDDDLEARRAAKLRAASSS